MSLNDFLSLITRVSFLAIAGITLIDFLRYRDRTRLDIALMFGSLGMIFVVQVITTTTGIQERWLTLIGSVALIAQPYFLLRLVEHFRRVPRMVEVAAIAGMVASAAILVAVPAPLPPPFTLLIVAYFAGVEGYAAQAFVRGSITTRGVTRRRLTLAAIGSGFLAAAVLVAGINSVLPTISSVLSWVPQFLAVLAAVGYYFGFAPPRLLRRVWQHSELYSFVREAYAHPGEKQTSQTLELLCEAAIQATGGMSALAALWDDKAKQMKVEGYSGVEPQVKVLPIGEAALQRAWEERRPILALNPVEWRGQGAPLLTSPDARVLFVVPITATQHDWGLLLVFLRRSPLFPADDLELLALFSEQSAVVLNYSVLLSEQRALVEELHRRTAQLEAANKKLQMFAALAESSYDFVSMATMQGEVFYLNRYGRDLVGLGPDEELPKALEAYCEPATWELIAKEGLPRLQQEGRWSGEGRLRNFRTEAVVDIHMSAFIIRDPVTGELLCLGAIDRNITERKQAEAVLAQRSAELEAANKELEAFAYSVSHDLRAPLRSIDGFSQVVLEEYAPRLDEQGKNYLQRVRAGSQRMAQLIDDLLQLSRVTRSEMHREKVDLTAVAWSITQELQRAHPERKVEFVVAPEVVAEGDPRLLRVVLENLLNNAWKFTGQHPTARIEFGVMDGEDGKVYFVRDDGVGFDMAYADKLFGAFQRLHGSTEFSGTGIGLATVQRIIHRHGGRVWAEGEVGKGATFYFTLT